MIDKENLSKYKYVYRVYLGRDDQLYTLRERIVYANKSYVYVKKNGSDELEQLSFVSSHWFCNYIFTDLDEVAERKLINI